MERGTLNCDLLVIGAGMGGMTGAAYASQLGMTAIVVEKAPEIGGSAALSEGYIWTGPSMSSLRSEDPGLDDELADAMLAGFQEALDWVRSLSVEVGPRVTGILGFGAGHQIDIRGYLERCRAIVEANGGWVLTSSEPHTLLTDDEARVTGATVQDASGDEAVIDSNETLVATGGFQASRRLLDQFLSSPADFALRSNPYSSGRGIELARAVGAAITEEAMEGFYGHLVPRPMDNFQPEHYALLAQYYSGHAVLLNGGGERFTDESLGDHWNAQMVARQDGCRAVLVADERIRQDHIIPPFLPGMGSIDKMTVAAEHGARYGTAPSLEDLAERVAVWGLPQDRVLRSLVDFNASVSADGDALDPPRRRNRKPVSAPPLAALEVQPAITFTFGGLRTDRNACVLGEDDRPIPGLLAAGVDAGGLNREGYTGGLVRGLVFGRVAAQTAAGQKDGPVPPSGPGRRSSGA